MKLVCRYGHSKGKIDLYASLHHQEYCQYQKYLLMYQETTRSKSAQFSKFRLSEGTAAC